jgi:hypothetical protein
MQTHGESVTDDSDHVSLNNRCFISQSVCNANVTHCILASNGGTNVFRIQETHWGVMLAGRNIMVDLPSGTSVGVGQCGVIPPRSDRWSVAGKLARPT